MSDDEDLLMASINMSDVIQSTPNVDARKKIQMKKLAHGSYSYASERSELQLSGHQSSLSHSLAAMSSQEKLEIRAWGLPPCVEAAYEKVCSDNPHLLCT